jgi:hypothetical protein
VDYLLKTTEVGTELPFLGTVERCGQRKKYIGMTHPRRLLCKKACVQCPGLQDAREKTMGGVVLRGAPRQCTRTSYQGDVSKRKGIRGKEDALSSSYMYLMLGGGGLDVGEGGRGWCAG